MNKTTMPDFCTQEHLDYLVKLRDSGETNMFGAAPYLVDEFYDISISQARKILSYWMKTF
jgi:hypothetical protein